MLEPTLNYHLCPDAAGGHRMAYWQWGNPLASQVVVCVHGLTRQGRDFDTLARALVNKRGDAISVVCPDVVGRGRSDWLKDPTGYQIPAYAADMLVLLKQLKPDRLDWVGTSMGGLIGMVLAGQPHVAVAPGREALASSATADAGEVASVGVNIHRLVLNDVGPAMRWQALQRIGEYLGHTGKFSSLQAAADALWASSSTFGPHTPAQWLAFSSPMVKPMPDHPGYLTLHYDPAIAVPYQSVTPQAVQQGEAMLWQLYDNIEAETLLLRGAQSDLLSLQTAQAMMQRGPKATLVQFEGVGHAPTLIADEQVQAVVSFLIAK
jgi:pimeloyl-ACP methyl ester carboxylesterase